MGDFTFSNFDPIKSGSYKDLRIVNSVGKTVTEKATGEPRKIVEVTFMCKTASKTNSEDVVFEIGFSPILSPASQLGKNVAALLGIQAKEINGQFADRFYLSQFNEIVWQGVVIAEEVSPNGKARNTIALAKPSRFFKEYIEQLALYLTGKTNKPPEFPVIAAAAAPSKTASLPDEDFDPMSDDD